MDLGTLDYILIIFNSIAFGYFGLAWFFSPLVKEEFIRLNILKLGGLVAAFEVAGAIGCFVGIWYKELLIFSCSGLAVLMFLGLIVRARTVDAWFRYIPAVFLMVLNIFIVYRVV